MTDCNNFVLKRIGTYDFTGNHLGKGNFAYVELAINRVTKSKVAIKVIDTRNIKDEYVRKNVLREALLLKRLKHPNILRLYETLKQRSTYCIVTEYVPGGELLSLLRCQNDSKLSESQARPIMRQLASALHHIHEQGIVHRDLKMENILFDDTKGNIKIIDFGLSNICQRGDVLKTQCGSPEYAAPELFRKGCQYGSEVDLWSLGIIMYGIVVGRLPFRSPHAASRGRNDLVDQMSRGLSLSHKKFLVKLTPQCRDLLRKLIEPNPQMRLPLLDVMIHPWITLQGTQPLVPYTSQAPAEELRNKVLQKASQLIKMDKSKIAFHVERNRYDAISGVYHLLLDEELKNATEPGNRAKLETDVGEAEDGPIIRVSITQGGNYGNQNDASRAGSEGALESNSKISSCAERDCEAPQTVKNIVSRRNDETPTGKPLSSLQVKGIRICRTEMRLPKQRPHAKTRPNTATPENASSVNTARENIAAACLKHLPGTRCKLCMARDETPFKNKVRGRRVVMSPRTRQNVKSAAMHAQWALKLEALESENACSQPSKEKVNSVETAEPESIHVMPGDGKAKLSFSEKQSDTAVQTQNLPQESKLITESTKADAKVNPGQKFVLSRKSEAKSSETAGKTGSSSPASQTREKPVFPIKTSQFVNMANFQKHVPHAPKRQLSTGEKSRSGDSGNDKTPVPRTAANADRIEETIDSSSLSSAYQSYMTSNKPQHRRLSIMQAHEILQHESKFHAKYGRRLTAECSAADRVKSQEIAPVSTNANDEIFQKPTSSPVTRFFHGNVKSNSGISTRTNLQHCATSRETNLLQSTVNSAEKPGRWTASTTDRRLHEDSPNKHNLKRSESGKEETEINDHDESRTKEAQLTPRQEESLKRQKDKEQMDDQERERVRLQQVLEDRERQKMVQEYLENVYTQNQVQTASLQGDTRNSEPNHRETKHCRPHMSLSRPLLKSSAHVPQIVGRSTPVLHQTFGSAPGEKRVTFKPHSSFKGSSGVRFQSDWNGTFFSDYINSAEAGSTDQGQSDNFQSQLNDASYWLYQHLYGVVDETTARHDFHSYKQTISRST